MLTSLKIIVAFQYKCPRIIESVNVVVCLLL